MLQELKSKPFNTQFQYVLANVLNKMNVSDEENSLKVKKKLYVLCFNINKKWKECRHTTKTFFDRNRKWLEKEVEIVNPLMKRPSRAGKL